jgi:hypothetical protein
MKFHDVPYDAMALVYDVDRYLDKVAWAKLRDKSPNLPAKPERLFTAVTPERIFELVQEVKALALSRHQYYKPTNFFTYFRVPCPEGVSAKAVAKALSEWPGVEHAYVAGGPSHPPTVDPINEPLWPQYQKHLSPAPLNHIDAEGGIGAEHAWGILGGDGAGPGLQFIDVEQGWDLTHKALPKNVAGQPAIQLIYGASHDYHAHGTNVLCTVVGAVNSVDGVGIAPNVPTKMVASIWNNNTIDRENAYLAALNRLNKGDVLLLEDQIEITNTNIPVEAEQALFDAIRDFGTARDIIVIEPAGNGGVDLDQFYNPPPPSTGWGDSGAIMVAAATVLDSRLGGGGPPRSRRGDFNYGMRIDCYAWGEGIITRQEGANTMSFGHSSGASAMLAGIALVLQGIRKANTGTSYSPEELRSILRNWRNGTVSANSKETAADWNRDLIGVMPDLKKITVNENLVPDIFIRDNTTDDGSPHQGSASSSPDIILRDTRFNPLPDPDRVAAQAAYGEGMGNEDNPSLSISAVQGKDHYIYVRVRNRGGAGAENVAATVYWSEAATLLDPSLWKRVDQPANPQRPSVVIPLVPNSNILTVSSAIMWPGPQIPVAGHYCFIALVDHVTDPAPALADFQQWDNFLKFIRENNNVTWRNFNVVEYRPADSTAIPLHFIIAGAWDQARVMRLEVAANLPAEAQITLEAPFDAENILNGFGSIGPITKDALRQVFRVRLSPEGLSRGEEIQFPERLRAKSQLLINLPPQFRRNSYEVSIRQLCGRVEVGRVSWQLKPTS